jgi:DNA repair exonuclease SbcCD nuclease subunit
MQSHLRYSRREMLSLSAGHLLALGLWPGALRAQDNGRGGEFHFVVVNDVHFLNDRCAAFLERVLETMKAGPKPDLCLLVGDQADDGSEAALKPVKEVFTRLGVPVLAVPGNHDYLSQADRSAYDRVFPERLNFSFEHQGWLFVGLDTTEGLRAEGTTIQPATLQWLDENLSKLDRKSPMVVFTHFPLGPTAPKRPRNTDALLARFKDHNLRAVFGGHHHAFTEGRSGETVFVTNRCCSISRGNHDGTKEKGYFLCEARDGKAGFRFVEVDTNLPKNAGKGQESPVAK